jgi:hypothetical protein
VWAQASLGYVGFGCKSHPCIERCARPALRDRSVFKYRIELGGGGRLRSAAGGEIAEKGQNENQWEKA